MAATSRNFTTGIANWSLQRKGKVLYSIIISFEVNWYHTIFYYIAENDNRKRLQPKSKSKKNTPPVCQKRSNLVPSLMSSVPNFHLMVNIWSLAQSMDFWKFGTIWPEKSEKIWNIKRKIILWWWKRPFCACVFLEIQKFFVLGPKMEKLRFRIHLKYSRFSIAHFRFGKSQLASVWDVLKGPIQKE